MSMFGYIAYCAKILSFQFWYGVATSGVVVILVSLFRAFGSVLLFTVVLQGARASICRFILCDDIWWRCFASASDREILIYLSSLFLVESVLCFSVLTFVVLFNLPTSTATLIDCYLYFKYPEGYCKEYLVVIVIIVDVISVGFIDKLRFKYVSVSSCRIRTREQKLFKCFIACTCVCLLSSFIPKPNVNSECVCGVCRARGSI